MSYVQKKEKEKKMKHLKIMCVWFCMTAMAFAFPNDGSAWSEMDSGTTDTLWGVWGSSGSDVFAVGDNGTILHYNGSTWSPMIFQDGI